jgi:hypothetical protein
VGTPLKGVPGIAEVADGCFSACVVSIDEEREAKSILLVFGWDLVDFAVVSCDQ